MGIVAIERPAQGLVLQATTLGGDASVEAPPTGVSGFVVDWQIPKSGDESDPEEKSSH